MAAVALLVWDENRRADEGDSGIYVSTARLGSPPSREKDIAICGCGVGVTVPPPLDFEQQVLEALHTVPGKQYDSHAHFLQDTEGERFEYWLRAAAPRIVAACRATRHATYWQCARSLDGVDHVAIDHATLGALRGTTPAEGVER